MNGLSGKTQVAAYPTHLHTRFPLQARRLELCVISNAFTKAIGVVAYLRAINKIETVFSLEKTKLAPQTESTIPRLELCAAVLAVEMAEHILDEINLTMDAVKFYCDSKVVLRYIHNEVKHFYMYVHNRVQQIRQSTKPYHWFYVPTEPNLADHVQGCPCIPFAKMTWLSEPAFLNKRTSKTNMSPLNSSVLNLTSNCGQRCQVSPHKFKGKPSAQTSPNTSRHVTHYFLIHIAWSP